MRFPEEDEVIGALAAKSPDEPFTMSVCPGGTNGSADHFDVESVFEQTVEVASIFVVAVTKEVFWRRMIPCGLQHLAVGPFGGGMFGGILYWNLSVFADEE
jgi:hypothetical protein